MFLCCSNTMIHKPIGLFFLKTQYGNCYVMVYLLAYMIEKIWLIYVAFLSAVSFFVLAYQIDYVAMGSSYVYHEYKCCYCRDEIPGL